MFRTSLTACVLAALTCGCTPSTPPTAVPSLPAVTTVKPQPFLVRFEQEGVANPRLPPGPDDQVGRIVVDDVLIHFPEEGVWKACRFNGEAWVAPANAERRTIRVTGAVEEAVGWGLTPGHSQIAAVVWCDSPKGVGNGTYGRSLAIDGERFTAEFWARGGGELEPYLDPFSGDGPMVDVDVHLFQYGVRMNNGKPKSFVHGPADIKVLVAYP